MLEGKDPALCHPGCVHQPVPLPGGPPPSHFIYWHHPPRMVYTTNLQSGAEGKDCTSCPGSGGPLNTTSNLGRCLQWCDGVGVT